MAVKNVPVVPRPWAKLQRDCAEGRGDGCRAVWECPVTSALSLIGPSADVAAVMHALFEQPTIASRLARLLGRAALTTEGCAKLIALAALHDVGKINQGFQRKPFGNGKPVGHVKPVVTLLNTGEVELQALRRQRKLDRLLYLLVERSDDFLPFDATMAHHGSLPCAGDHDPGIWREVDGYDPLLASRHLFEVIVEWCPEALSKTPLGWTPAFQHAFAGCSCWLTGWAATCSMPACRTVSRGINWLYRWQQTSCNAVASCRNEPALPRPCCLGMLKHLRATTTPPPPKLQCCIWLHPAKVAELA
jgi:hypothetical protein